ncbi:hypothetical protein Mycch_3235 [Mycolicibacterium chubuense NBB4]|uniref:Uncharacterized protein n=1 Tax=Mycolicibacterium chubuense (strain NBB4) TaxID=710421 RepID=I4BL26_MYCCN|nr:hypothetical protein [Mycolicibacterium chubuense]AFM17983.1 hypothetical protein Mycch_3235 [Mycolicibacterium chubuense NBB4]
MNWKLAGVSVAVAAIATAVPIAAAHPNGHGHGGPNAPGQAVAGQAREGHAPAGVVRVIQQSVAPQAPGLRSALAHIPTIVPPMPTFPPPMPTFPPPGR